MATIIIGVLVLVFVLWAVHVFARADTKQLVRTLKTVGGGAALVGAVGLAATGRFGIAVPLGLAGLALLGWWPGGPAGFGQRWNKSPGQVSRVRTAFVEMDLDHDSGNMTGRILAGRHEGASLDALDVATLLALVPEIDPESRGLLAAYLDRRSPGWREHVQDDAAAGQSVPGGGPMSAQEAYQILGVQPGASAEEIGRAHRTLMKKLHPDQGGSTYLAAQINKAKETLLHRHR
jgi:hypothetical protein